MAPKNKRPRTLVTTTDEACDEEDRPQMGWEPQRSSIQPPPSIQPRLLGFPNTTTTARTGSILPANLSPRGATLERMAPAAEEERTVSVPAPPFFQPAPPGPQGTTANHGGYASGPNGWDSCEPRGDASEPNGSEPRWDASERDGGEPTRDANEPSRDTERYAARAGNGRRTANVATARDRSGANNRRRFVRRGRLRRDGKCATAQHKLIRAAYAKYHKYIRSALRSEY